VENIKSERTLGVTTSHYGLTSNKGKTTKGEDERRGEGINTLLRKITQWKNTGPGGAWEKKRQKLKKNWARRRGGGEGLQNSKMDTGSATDENR